VSWAGGQGSSGVGTGADPVRQFVEQVLPPCDVVVERHRRTRKETLMRAGVN
jgi:hypothetical protein